MKVILGISNRHVHLTKEHLSILFGENYELKKIKDLNQPNQFLNSDRVILKTEKGTLENVAIVGPLREYTQVEISKTDAINLGLNPPIRTSGDLKNSETITIIGPKGDITIEGCIISDRHIHITPKQKELYDLNDTVSILVNGSKKGIISNVHLKVSEETYYELHLDTDDANAFSVENGQVLEIISK